MRDWFRLGLVWLFAIVFFALCATKPKGVWVNERIKYLPVLVAISWTAGFAGIRRLREIHDTDYDQLGRPQVFDSFLDKGKSFWRFWCYVFGFRFWRVRDAVLNAYLGAFAITQAAGIAWLLYSFARAARAIAK
jgi:hypothetical protein